VDNVEYTADEQYAKFGLKKPTIAFIENPSQQISISTNFRGERYVFSNKVLYNPILDKYVTEYTQGSGDN
jgi:hypothetical protein